MLVVRVDGDGELQVPREDGLADAQPMDIAQGPSSADLPTDTVSAIDKCQSQQARKLAIFDVCYKLNQMENYDIGGTCTGSKPDLWFYYTTSICSGPNYLLNLFVCHRTVGTFSVAVSSSNELNLKEDCNSHHAYLPDEQTWYKFRSAKVNENYHLKTYCFNKNGMQSLENYVLYIPVTIEMDPAHTLNEDVIKTIKLNHDFGDLLAKKDTTDFVLETASGKKFPVHKIILAAHSPVLRTMIRVTSSKSEFIDISDTDMELLLQFIYTGTIKEIKKQDCLKLLEIADRFKLTNLFALTQFAISEQISVQNAVDVALLSEKYTLKELQRTVFEYIKNNPAVLETDGWKNLNDVTISKKLFQYMYKNSSSRE